MATDAIGMGLNMHVDHVAFAATRKFDGRGPRRLTAAEMAQIAGRAGRHTRDGSFGTTAEIGPLDAELAQRIENHSFEPLTALQWRNPDLRFTSIEALRTSLGRLPQRPGLVRAREADDELALTHLGGDPEIARLARGPAAIALLWDVCRIPDFGKITGEGHARLLAQIYRFLIGADGMSSGRLPTDWVARQVDRLSRTDGDIETLMQRIAGIRTWTYVAHQGAWLADGGGWQERTRQIEDKLSDALHDRLIQRFVDRRAASLMGHMRQSRDLFATVGDAGEVLVAGHFVGTLDGFRFAPDLAVTGGRPAETLPDPLTRQRCARWRHPSAGGSSSWRRMTTPRSRWPPTVLCCGATTLSAGCTGGRTCWHRASRCLPRNFSRQTRRRGCIAGSAVFSRRI
ncbi:MAG: hypothetical protein IPK78_05830 [Rhodospirillales bacterium]|nr:hypothetical protein [Rhodospirillales bacterium]